MRLIVLFILFTACSHHRQTSSYPKSWWKEIPKESAHYWEILPTSAKNGEVILSKRTELGILSNFAHTPFVLDGVKYESLEGFWQMMKFPEGASDSRNKLRWTKTRKEVSTLVGFKAKRAGKEGSINMKKLGINFITYNKDKMPYRTSEKGKHYHLIVRATKAKVMQNKLVKDVLLKTKGLILKPDHKQKPNTPPAWKYFEILMEIRDSL